MMRNANNMKSNVLGFVTKKSSVFVTIDTLAQKVLSKMNLTMEIGIITCSSKRQAPAHSSLKDLKIVTKEKKSNFRRQELSMKTGYVKGCMMPRNNKS